MWNRWQSTVGFALGLAMLMSAGQTMAQQVTSFKPGVQSSDGTWVSVLDNPVFQSNIPLTNAQAAERVADHDSYTSYYFEAYFNEDCPTGDTLCRTFHARNDSTSMGTWARFEGHWEDPQIVPVETHGTHLGFGKAQFTLMKYDQDSNTTQLASATARLDQGVIVVPVNVVIVVPSASVDSSLSNLAAQYTDPSFYESIFDDKWTMTRSRASLAGHLDYLSISWTTRTHPGPTETSDVFRRITQVFDPIMSPDDVFAQCGVQFRLASVSAIEETDPTRIYFMAAAGNPICAGEMDNSLGAVYRSWDSKARTEPSSTLLGTYNNSGISVVFSPLIAAECVGPYTFGLTPGNGRVAAIAISHPHEDAPELTLAHEIGHTLGLDHPPIPCSNDLMCGAGSGETTHLVGCQLRNGSPLDAIPYGCNPDPADTTSVCDKIRTKAQQITGTSAGQAPPFAAEPPSVPGGTSWTAAGSAMTFNKTLYSEGTASLEVRGGAYLVAASPMFNTADVSVVGTKLDLDVYLRSPQPNQYWLGTVDAFLSIDSAGIHNAYLGHQDLTGLALESWSTLSFPVTDTIRTALLGDYARAQISFAINTPVSAPNVLIDNVRFAGDTSERTAAHAGPLAGGASNSLMSFESTSDWTVSAGTINASNVTTDGTSAVSIQGNGYVELTSRMFATSTLTGVTNSLSLDLLVPTNPPNPYWLGAVQFFATCPTSNLYNQPIGQADLSGAFFGEYNTLRFVVPTAIQQAFGKAGGTCQFKIALNVSQNSGMYTFDHLAFR